MSTPNTISLWGLDQIDPAYRLARWDDLLAANILLLWDHVLEVPEEDRPALASRCAQIIATRGDVFMFPTGAKPALFRLYPPDVLWEPGRPLKRWVQGTGAEEYSKFSLEDAPAAMPLLYGEYPFGQVMAIGLICAWLATPENAAAGAYGPARLFPITAETFRELYHRRPTAS